MIFRLLSFFLASLSILLADLVRIDTFQGKEISPNNGDIIKFVNEVYREYPYLYEGTDEEYTTYLKNLSLVKDALVCLAFNGDKPIGVAIGLPMTQTRDFYKQVLLSNGYDLKSLFYLGEFGVNPEFQKQEIENTLYQKLEDFAKKSGQFSTLAVWELDNTPLPFGYLPKDDFWTQHGFVRHPELNFELYWKNINDSAQSSHKAVYALKKL